MNIGSFTSVKNLAFDKKNSLSSNVFIASKKLTNDNECDIDDIGITKDTPSTVKPLLFKLFGIPISVQNTDIVKLIMPTLNNIIISTPKFVLVKKSLLPKYIRIKTGPSIDNNAIHTDVKCEILKFLNASRSKICMALMI
ncbi:hypothetical protein K7A41_09430 [Sphingobacterium sp. InxBP1]|uniref:hypothetical protein n=1 Tax=Sphingobacterium sp. InxBP1 TaxID=2870328 RepID=UPI0022430051|nr:hypothetical protein [Sphingobacterium sp. InxBP1]MCW8311444.1 hypothetical protein [Sphingobacterium sp. InxBP1]